MSEEGWEEFKLNLEADIEFFDDRYKKEVAPALMALGVVSFQAIRTLCDYVDTLQVRIKELEKITNSVQLSSKTLEES